MSTPYGLPGLQDSVPQDPYGPQDPNRKRQVYQFQSDVPGNMPDASTYQDTYKQNTPTLPRQPRPGEAQGEAADNTIPAAHGHETHSTTGHDNPPDQHGPGASPQNQFGATDFYKDIQDPSEAIRKLGPRPSVGGQFGSSDSLVGAISGFVHSSQLKKQQDWDNAYMQSLGPYDRQIALAKLREAQYYQREQASHIHPADIGVNKEGTGSQNFVTGKVYPDIVPSSPFGAIQRRQGMEYTADQRLEAARVKAGAQNMNLGQYAVSILKDPGSHSDQEVADAHRVFSKQGQWNPAGGFQFFNTPSGPMAGSTKTAEVKPVSTPNNAPLERPGVPPSESVSTSTEKDAYDAGGHKIGKTTSTTKGPASGPKPFGIKPPLGNAGGGSTEAPEGTRVTGPKGDLIKKNGKWVPVSN